MTGRADPTKAAPQAVETPIVVRCPRCKSEFVSLRWLLREDGTIVPDIVAFGVGALRCGECQMERTITLAEIWAGGRRITPREIAKSGA